MRVKVSGVLSSPWAVNGGAPQGSCTGVQMYSVGTDDIDGGLPEPPMLRTQEIGSNPEWSFVRHDPRALEDSLDPEVPVAGPSGLGQSGEERERQQQSISAGSSADEYIQRSTPSDNPLSPYTNLRIFQDYSALSNSLASLNLPGAVANYDPGGEETGVHERW